MRPFRCTESILRNMENVDLIQTIQQQFPESAEDIIERFDFHLIEAYNQFLISKNLEGGFFSKKDTDLILMRHLVETIYFVYSLVGNGFVSRETKLIDVGTGPGLPGFIFLCLVESPRVFLLDSAKRKLGLLEEWWKIEKKEFPGKNLQFKYERAEEMKGKYDLAVMRASVPYPFSIEVVTNLVATGGYFCPFLAKEQNWKTKEEQILSATGFVLEGNLELEELSFLGTRQIKVLKKLCPPKHGFPRDWKILSKDIKEAEWVK
jgi:16S rRNA (guanine527-N7)-methyltransferase